VAVAESAPQGDTRSVCVIRTTVGQYFNWTDTESRRSLGNSGVACSHKPMCQTDRLTDGRKYRIMTVNTATAYNAKQD